MTNHPAIDLVIERIVKDLIGGAADTAKEVMSAMSQVVTESKASSMDALFAEMDAAALALLKICPSFAPPINVLHMLMGTLERDMETGVSLGDARRHLAETEANFNSLHGDLFRKNRKYWGGVYQRRR